MSDTVRMDLRNWEELMSCKVCFRLRNLEATWCGLICRITKHLQGDAGMNTMGNPRFCSNFGQFY